MRDAFNGGLSALESRTTDAGSAVVAAAINYAKHLTTIAERGQHVQRSSAAVRVAVIRVCRHRALANYWGATGHGAPKDESRRVPTHTMAEATT